MELTKMQEALSTMRESSRSTKSKNGETPSIGDNAPRGTPGTDSVTVVVNYEDGTSEVKSTLGKVAMPFDETDRREFTDNAKEIQKALIAEKAQSLNQSAALHELMLMEKSQSIETSRATAKAKVREAQMATLASFGMAALAIVTAAGAGFAMYQGSSGKNNTTL